MRIERKTASRNRKVPQTQPRDNAKPRKRKASRKRMDANNQPPLVESAPDAESPFATISNTKLGKAEPEQRSSEIAKPYEITPEERSAVETIYARWKKTPPVKVSKKEGRIQISLEHPAPVYGQCLLMETFATADHDFYKGILMQLVKAATLGQKVDEQELNFMISIIKGIAPKDELETLLATQMAAVHTLILAHAHQLANTGSIPQQDCAERTLNKLARTFAVQVETLKHYRTGGEQKVTVQHVTVSDGGQAIVGHVTQGAQGATKKQETTS
jgi:hypothetical protein